MDPQELLGLLGYSGHGGSQADYSGYADLLYPQPDAVTGADPATPAPLAPPGQGAVAAPESVVGGARTDFQPRTVDETGQPMPQVSGVGTSSSGYSPAKMDAIEAGPMGSQKTAAKKDAHRTAAEGRMKPYMNAMGEVAAGESSIQDQAGDLAFQSEMIRAEGMGKISSEQTRHVAEMKALADSALIAKQGAKDAYRQKLLEIPEVNPNALWDEAGAGGQFQMAAAAFVHNMLAVKGIKTTAMDTINQAIQNKIDAQIQNIKTKKEVAAGFKDLYDMTVADSASEMEVRDKMHGYMLKAMETGIDAEMGKINAPQARLKHQQAKMEIRKALINNMMGVEKHIDDSVDKAYQRDIQIRGQNISASNAREERNMQWKIANLRAEAEKKKADAPVYVYDPETGKGKFKFKPGIKQETVMKKLEEAGKFEAANATMSEIRALERKMGPQLDGISRTRLAPEDARRYNALVTNLAHQLVAARGERPTDKDVEQQLKSLPMDTKATNGSVDRILADTQRGLSREFNSQLRQFVDDVPEGEQPPGVKGLIAEGSLTDAQLTSDGAQDISAKKYDSLIKAARSPDALDTFLPNSDEHKQFTVPLWQEWRKENPEAKTNNSFKGASGFSDSMKDPPTKGFDAVREIAEHAVVGDKEAVAELTQLASELDSSSADSVNTDANTRSYAQWFLDRIKKPATNSLGYEPLGQ